MIARLTALALLLAAPAVAQEPMTFAPGDVVRLVRDYDRRTDSFTQGAPTGTEEACFQVTEVTDTTVSLRHLSGYYKPWWSDEVIAPGSVDEWFDSISYEENRPGDPPLSQISRLFGPAPGCRTS